MKTRTSIYDKLSQAKTEQIMMKVLAKKGLNYKDYEEIISMKLECKFGRKPKVMEFGD